MKNTMIKVPKYSSIKTLYKLILQLLRDKTIVEFLYFIVENDDAYTVNPIVLDATTTESFTQPPLAEEEIPSGIHYC